MALRLHPLPLQVVAGSLSLASFALGLSLLQVSGCRGNTSLDDGYQSDGTAAEAGTTGERDCPECIGYGEFTYFCGCKNLLFFPVYVCVDDADEADYQCDLRCTDYEEGDAEVVPCGEYSSSMNCSSWAPENEITQVSNFEYAVEDTFIADLIADPEPLWGCDDAYLDPITNGNFVLKNASSGEFLYELGFRNNDTFTGVNEMPLGNYAEAIEAFQTLYIDEAEVAYDLDFGRGQQNLTISIDLE